MKRFLLVSMILVLVSQVGCSSSTQQAAPAPASTATVSPPTSTSTIEPTATLTPTATVTPTPRLPVEAGTSIPPSSQVLSAENIDKAVELARWGKGVITDAAYSPDGKLIAIATTLGISIYQADTLDEKIYFETDASINSLVFSSDGETLAAGLNDNTVKIWKASDGTLLKSIEGHKKEKTTKKDSNKEEVSRVAFSPDGSLIAGGSTDGSVSLWRVSDGSLVYVLKNHTLYVSSVFFSPDGQALFSASHDGAVRMMNVSDGKLLHAFGTQLAIDATISADGKILAAYDHGYYTAQGSLILWDVQSGKKLQTIKGNEPYSSVDIRSIALSPDGQFVAAGWRDHTAKMWSVASGVAQSSFEDLRPKSGWFYYVLPTVAFSPDSQSLLLTDSNSIGIWNIKSGSLLKNSTIKTDSIYKLALSPDGQTLASSEGPNVNLLKISDGSLIPAKDSIQSNGSLAFSPDGTTLLVSMFDDTARLWPLSDQGIRKSFETEKKEYILGIAFSPDGKVVALITTYPSAKVELRQVADSLLLKTLTLENRFGFGGMAFSPSGEFLGISMNDQIKLYRVADGKLVKSFKGGSNLSFSPDGTLLAGGGQDKTVTVWKIPTGETVFALKDRASEVYSVIFSPDGKLLVSGTADGTIDVFLASDGTLLKSWKGHSYAISDLIFSSDGKMLISSSWDGTIRFWGLKP